MLFNFDYCLCGNPDNCPHKKECLRAIDPGPGIYSYSFFYNENKECEDYIPKEVN